MSTPESTPALEALRLHVIGLVNEAFGDASLLGIISAANPALPAKLAAPQGKITTSPAAWRKHIQALHSELVNHFGSSQFRIKDLRLFLESRVELLPNDMDKRQGNNGAIWEKAIYDAIDCKSQTWGKGGAVIVYVSRDRWRVV